MIRNWARETAARVEPYTVELEQGVGEIAVASEGLVVLAEQLAEDVLRAAHAVPLLTDEDLKNIFN